MNITEKAKEYIEQTMKDNEIFTLRFYGTHGCCGLNLKVSLQVPEENDIVENVNGINIAIQPDMKDQLSGVTIDVEDEDGEIGMVLNGYNHTSCCC